ncbi:MAG: MarR family winged helix-turn-helix transcriptional regulator [Christensenellaceae bacterium]|jgi:DNA-binding MarR family transcriptional regulator|nr:MarR family winged helix-turn-helix transcriptional regulator [Christensenellaceae bacterium]
MESARRSHKPFADEIGSVFGGLQHTYAICMQLTLGKYGLYPGQPQILFALRQLNKPTQNEIADHLGIGKASAGISLRRLESGGFVTRIRDKKDTRCIRLTLTKKGEDYARWCEIDYSMFFNTMLESLSTDEQDVLLAMLQRMDTSLTSLKARLES